MKERNIMKKSTPLNPDFKHTLYTVSKCKSSKDVSKMSRSSIGPKGLFKKTHGSHGLTTLCGKNLDWHWYIRTNNFDGEITCKECLKKFEDPNFGKD